MVLRWIVILYSLIASGIAYWGEVPATKETIQLSSQSKDIASLEVSIQSHSLGRLVLELKLNSEITLPGLQRYTVTDSGRVADAINSACHYGGEARYPQHLSVQLSSCSGRFRGSMSSSNETWYILYHQERYIIFSDSDLPNPIEVMTAEYNGVELPHNSSELPPRLGSAGAAPTFLGVERMKREESVMHKTLEVVVVTDKSLWIQFGKKIDDVVEFVLDTMSYIDEIYKQYGIRVALVGLENWRTNDLIDVTTSYTMTLRNFTMYRQEKLLNAYKQHDVSILMTAVDFEGPVIGYAGVDVMCRSSCSNVNFNSRSNPRFYATVIAHEIGHNFGMYHDSEECVCPPEDSCVMSSMLGTAVTTFSNCSTLLLDSFKGPCLNNQPKTLFGDPVCGNGFVEEGEECDCGTEEECLASDPCCEPVGCKLKYGSECYTGECCDRCKFRSYKTECRPASSECDLREFCTGTDAQCPTNRYKQDGSQCGGWGGGWDGFCNYGSCQTREGQCVSLWGESASVSQDFCYRYYNAKGQWYGNCGSLDNRKYVACIGENVMCGKLYCEVQPDVKSHIRNIYRRTLTYNDTATCTLGTAVRTAENNDSAMVYDGTRCGDSKWCMAGQCVEFEKVACPSPGDLECGGHGSCNDLNQCHCDAGYDPQFNCAILLPVAGWDIKTIVIAVMIIVLVILPIAITAILMLRKYNANARTFFDKHTRIRFSIRLPSLSRRASYIQRQNSRRKKPVPSSKNPPPRPVKLPGNTAPARPATGPGRPPGSYRTSSGWATSAYRNTPPSRPPKRYTTSPPGSKTSSVYYSPPPYEEGGAVAGDSNDYTPLSLHPTPARPAPLPPSDEVFSAPNSRPTSEYNSPFQKSGPKAFQAGTRDNVKLDISGPESARKLIDDKPLDDRTLAGSPLRELQR